jgi:glutamate-1-semialdehyde aminotransferase
MIAEPRIYAARCSAHNVPARMPMRTLRQMYVEVVNDGNWAWERLAAPGPSVDLAIRVDGALVSTMPLPVDRLEPGERCVFTFKWRSPAEPGPCDFEYDMVQQNVTFFAAHQTPMLQMEIALDVHEPTESERYFDISAQRNYWFYLPTEGIAWSAHGRSYPMFVRDGVGSKFRDLEGREYLDYVMGWGSCLLGYAHPHVQAAIAKSLASSPLVTLPYAQELALSEKLSEVFPSAEMSAFGKNGSDVTTVAVRLARLATGRTHVLFSGFHGWQDWNTTIFGNTTASTWFAYGDVAALDELLGQHDGDVAAIVVEAAAQVQGVQGPVPAADGAFLQALRDRCDRLGIVLVFDEIWTGFRYLDGSVQHHTGVAPDLTCLGKSLSNGMPLAAVVGKRDVFTAAVHKIQYTPTFKGEMYSFEAALAAIEVFQREDVPAAVWAYGARLMRGIDELCVQTGVPAHMTGLPARMVFAFDLAEETRRVNARTLLTQELLREGLLNFRGFMIPSLAHDERDLATTLEIYGRALTVVADALRRDAFVERLELPPII